MSSRTISPRQLVLPVGFVLVCVLLFAVAYREFGGSLPLEGSGYRVEVPLQQASNLVAGADVQIAGVKAGQVTAVRRDGSQALAEVRIDPDFAPVRRSTTALVRAKSLLGESYLELRPGKREGGDDIPNGGRVALDRVRPNVGVDEFLRSFGPRTRADLRSTFAGMADATRGRGSDISSALGSAQPLSRGLAQVLPRLAGQSASLQSFIANTGDVLDAVGAQDGNVRAAITAGDDVLATTAQQDRALAATVRALPPFLRQLDDTAQTVSAASPDLEAAVSALRPVAPLVRPAVDDLVTTLPTVTSVFGRLPSLIEAGKVGLGPYQKVLATTPKTFDALYPASRELIPIMGLFDSFSQEGLIAPLANLGAMTNGTTVGPGGKMINRAAGALFVSNETVGGWVKRLPSHRSNPYRKPGSFDDLAKQGFLTSYDCRNTGNPNYLPPLGTGVPPCQEQGPWTYDGKTAYYPRLQRAAP